MSTNQRVLIIEDEHAIAEALKLQLTKEGYEIEVVYDGREAIATLMLQRHDLVLLDLIMPGEDGIAILEKLHDAAISVPVIVTSNLSKEEIRQKAMDLGAIDFIVKSDTTLEQITDRIKMFFEKGT